VSEILPADPLERVAALVLIKKRFSYLDVVDRPDHVDVKVALKHLKIVQCVSEHLALLGPSELRSNVTLNEARIEVTTALVLNGKIQLMAEVGRQRNANDVGVTAHSSRPTRLELRVASFSVDSN
jgi:hypothetical protein